MRSIENESWLRIDFYETCDICVAPDLQTFGSVLGFWLKLASHSCWRYCTHLVQKFLLGHDFVLQI